MCVSLFCVFAQLAAHRIQRISRPNHIRLSFSVSISLVFSQCNRYGLTAKCDCSPQARYAVMIQSKVSHSRVHCSVPQNDTRPSWRYTFMCAQFAIRAFKKTIRSVFQRSDGGRLKGWNLHPLRSDFDVLLFETISPRFSELMGHSRL